MRQEGADSYLRAVEGASSFFDFLLESAARDHDLSTPTGRVNGLSDLLPFMLKVEDRVLRSELADGVAHSLGLRPELVQDQVRRARQQGRTEVGSKERETLLEASHSEKTLISWLLSDERARECFRAGTDDLSLARLPRSDLYRALLSEPAGTMDVGRLLESIEDGPLRRLVSWCAVEQDLEPVAREDLEEKVKALIEDVGLSSSRLARRKKAEVERELADAITNGDGAAARTLRDELHQLAREMHA